MIDRSTADLWHHPDIKPMFPDALAEGIRFYRKTGIYPINHGMVIKREIAEEHPWTVLNLFKAFKLRERGCQRAEAPARELSFRSRPDLQGSQ